MLMLNWFSTSIVTIFLWIDAIVYNFINYFYEIFLYLAELDIFGDKEYMLIVNRVYVILGVVMLFILAYSLLKAIINPDDFAKGETSFPNLIKNVVISLIIIAILPMAFSVATNIQHAVLNSGVIGKIILGTENAKDNTVVVDGGRTMAFYTFRAFFNNANNNAIPDSKIIKNTNISPTTPTSLEEADKLVLEGKTSFLIYSQFSEAVDDGLINYSIIISTIAGLFILWAILAYCFDLGIRVIKLIFYQIIAPIPVICKVLPGSKTKDIFPTWLKSTISTFLEVFIRVAIMYLGVFLISIVVEKFNGTDLYTGSLGAVQILLAKAFIIMGIVAFIRQAPKLIKDLFGIELGGAALTPKSLMERAKNGGAFAAQTSIGGFAKNGSRRMVESWKKNKGFKKLTGAITGGIGGAASGAIHGLYQGRNAANFSDVRKGMNTAVTNYEEKQAKKALDIAKYGKNPVERYKANLKESLSSFAGMGSVDELKGEKAKYDRIIGYNSSMKGIYGSELDRIDQEITKTNASTHGMLTGRTYDMYNDATDKKAAMSQITANRARALKDEFEHKTLAEQTAQKEDYYGKMTEAKRKTLAGMLSADEQEDILYMMDNGKSYEEASKQVFQNSRTIQNEITNDIAQEQASYEFKSGFRDVEALKLQQDQVKIDKLKKSPETIFSTMGQLVNDLKMNPEIEASLNAAGIDVNKFKGFKTQEDLNAFLQNDADYLEVANFFKKASDVSQDKSSKIAADIVRVQDNKS